MAPIPATYIGSSPADRPDGRAREMEQQAVAEQWRKRWRCPLLQALAPFFGEIPGRAGAPVT
jgi:hypothetical protein